MLRTEDRHSEVAKVDVTIAASAALSGAANLGGLHAVGILMPSGWTAANLTFQASVDGETYYDVYDKTGAELSVTAGTSRYIQLDLGLFAGFNFLKVRSGTTGTPVNQASARTVSIIARAL